MVPLFLPFLIPKFDTLAPANSGEPERNQPVASRKRARLANQSDAKEGLQQFRKPPVIGSSPIAGSHFRGFLSVETLSFCPVSL